jgi:hypothetical protein
MVNYWQLDAPEFSYCLFLFPNLAHEASVHDSVFGNFLGAINLVPLEPQSACYCQSGLSRGVPL